VSAGSKVAICVVMIFPCAVKQRHQDVARWPASLLASLIMPQKVAQQRRRPRKQASQERAQHTVNAIVEAAARILERQGHDGFNANAVAELAGVGIGKSYRYFPDRNALLGALVARETALLVRDAELAGMERSGPTALTKLIVAAVKQQLGHLNFVGKTGPGRKPTSPRP